ncbi:diacylglycerol kinase [Neisseriaceae bacterium TC5R-5]|nr:diacylglycerol kinase [Neisseriaceae bacterium TC5R-5]
MTKPQESPLKSKTELKRVYRATLNSLAGLKAAWCHEAAFRDLSILALVLLIIAFVIDITSLSRIMLVASTLAILVVELFNSAIEAAVDHTSLELHPLAKRAKDMASAAQLVCLLNLVLVWAMVLLGK